MDEARQELESLFNSASNTEEKTKELLLALLLKFFILGSGYEQESQLTNQDRQYLDEMGDLDIQAAKGIVARWETGRDMGPTVERVLHHNLGVFHYASVKSREDVDTMMSWEYGVTEEHCADCARFVAMGPQPVSYWQEQADQGFYPQSPALECAGLHCDCRYNE